MLTTALRVTYVILMFPYVFLVWCVMLPTFTAAGILELCGQVPTKLDKLHHSMMDHAARMMCPWMAADDWESL